LPPHFCLFHSHYAGIWHIMADMKIQWWKSGKTTINQWEGTVILRRGLKRDVGLFMHYQGFFGHFFFAHTISWAHYRLIVE
jgi:hypothetical protein